MQEGAVAREKWVLSVDFFIHSSSVSCKLLVPQKPTRGPPEAPGI